ncbi:MAG: hypothetical protein HMLKMBBP_02437 [Planctomycetes bacterium]|nr:hypothetical protein [Planctomycetota bacterium]
MCERLASPERTDARATSLTTLLHMAAGGLGVTVVPAMAVGSALWPGGPDGLRALPIRGRSPFRTIALAFRRTAARGDEIRAVAAALREHRPRGGDA